MVDMSLAGKCDLKLFMQLVWYCPFLWWHSSYWFSSCSQCAPNVLGWSMLVHGMVPACCSKSFGSQVWCGGYFLRTNVQCLCFVNAYVMHPVDMGRFFLPLWSIIWCQLADRPAAQTVHTPIRLHAYICFQNPSIIMIKSWTLLKS